MSISISGEHWQGDWSHTGHAGRGTSYDLPDKVVINEVGEVAACFLDTEESFCIMIVLP
jgi:hypothetical protein